MKNSSCRSNFVALCCGLFLIRSLAAAVPLGEKHEDSRYPLSVRTEIDKRGFTTLRSDSVTVPEGSSLEIVCLVQGTGRPSVSWYGDDIELPSNIDSNEFVYASALTIRDVAKEDHERTLQCLPSNSAPGKRFTLLVTDKTQEDTTEVTARVSVNGAVFETKKSEKLIFTQGDNVTLACIAQGTGHYNVSWLENERKIYYEDQAFDEFVSSAEVKLKNIQLEDSGRRFDCVDDNNKILKSFTMEIKESGNLEETNIIIIGSDDEVAGRQRLVIVLAVTAAILLMILLLLVAGIACYCYKNRNSELKIQNDSSHQKRELLLP